MKLPKLAIEGSHTDIRQFVAAQASKSGFQLTNCIPESAYELAQDDSSLLIWVTSQITLPKIIIGAEYMAPIKHDPRNLYANVVLFCTESLGERLLQIDRFLGEIKSGTIAAANTGQHWRGFTMPPVNYDFILPSWSKRVPA